MDVLALWQVVLVATLQNSSLMLTDFLNNVSLTFRSCMDEESVLSLLDTKTPLSRPQTESTFESASFLPESKSKSKSKSKSNSSNDKRLSAGDGWFNMSAPEITPEIEMDRELIRLRGQFDPVRRHYRVPKKKDTKDQVFQVGTVIASAFENGGVSTSTAVTTKSKARGRTVDTLLQNAELKEILNRKYADVEGRRRAGKKKRNTGYNKRRF
ncbi:hypothetical protein GEMRC1_002709 [Eukaryota sp. GEM-RC1]